ncbi:MAG: SLC13 family permease [Planctomycetota bacterium]|jgi:sodium-dependent dicarboxylate transporter 2/3/5
MAHKIADRGDAPSKPTVLDSVSALDKGAALAEKPRGIDIRRLLNLSLGLLLFCAVYFSPPWGPAVDPAGESFALTHTGKASLALFLLTATWWVTEVIPIGVTSLTVGVLQVLFFIRPAKKAFGDFMDPSVCFIMGSIVIGLVFTKTGLTKRLAYRMLSVVGEHTIMIYLGIFVLTAMLTLIMAHTAVAATVFPLIMAIHRLYDDGKDPTRFGKGLFMGMAFTAGAGSIITLLGAARGAVGIGFYKDIVGSDISFFTLTYYMLPLGLGMVFLLWVYFMVFFPPERKRIHGLRERTKALLAKEGPMTVPEWMALVFVFGTIAVLSMKALVPGFPNLDKSGIILGATVLFFVFRLLDIDDLEKIPWNIILLFGGAMSIGFCMWETGAAKWLAVKWLVLFEEARAFTFIMHLALFVLIMTNVIMNVAAIAITIPVALVVAGYLGIAPEVILFTCLATAGMPFLLLVGAAPNAIAYGSGQFTAKEFFRAGTLASVLLMVVLGLFVWKVWPLMGMPVTTR